MISNKLKEDHNLVDMHIHSTFSFDGSSTMEEYCQKAISMNVNKICFTDHVDFNTEEKNCGVVKDISIQNFDVEDYKTTADLV